MDALVLEPRGASAVVASGDERDHDPHHQAERGHPEDDDAERLAIASNLGAARRA
jgi:hypothetical protein